MTHLLKTIAISAVLVAVTTTGLLTALSMMSQQTALAQAVGKGGGCGTGGGSVGACIPPFTGGGGNGGNVITGSGGGGFGFGNNPSDPIFSHCGFGAGGSIGSGGTHGGGSC